MASLLPCPHNPKQEERESPLKASSFLPREMVLSRRSRRAKALYKRYRAQYWAMVEEIRAKHRKYYWDYGISPLEKENRVGDGETEGNNEGLGEKSKAERDKIRVRVRNKCAAGGCKSKAMPLTRFCHLHILADQKQMLYKGCVFITKSSGQSGPCGKPILRAVVPSLCPAHLQKAQKNLSQSLKKVGINLCSSSRPTAEFNVILVEYIHNIQAERKKALAKRSEVSNSTVDNMVDERKVMSHYED